MSTLGKICLSLTILLLLLALAPIPGKFGGWTPKLLVFHNQWSEKLRDAKADAADGIEKRAAARQELSLASTDLENQVTGWDRYWNIPRRGPQVPQNAPSLDKNNGRLILRNLGTNDGLVTKQVTDDNGAQQLMLPVVHAFYGGPEGFTYAGEFVATAAELTSAVLQPVHPVSPSEFSDWPVDVRWRLRGMIPSGARTSIDELHRRRTRTRELIRQTNANIGRQEGLLSAAEGALTLRKEELLGIPPEGMGDHEPIVGRPELTDGLLRAIEDLEEARNQLQLDVDHLRRALKKSVLERDQKRDALNGAANELPDSSSGTSLAPPQVTGRPATAN